MAGNERIAMWTSAVLGQNEGGRETGHSGFSQDQRGRRWLGGLTATRVFLRKTFQKGRRKKTPSPSVKSYPRPALFSVPCKGQGRKFYICHEISPREAAAVARGCHLGAWEPPAGAKEQQECGCQPSAPKAKKNKSGAWGPGDGTDLGAGMAGARPFSSAIVCPGDGPDSKTVACCYRGCAVS